MDYERQDRTGQDRQTDKENMRNHRFSRQRFKVFKIIA
jgi:hypothetical protein